jgi:hypothetical protein
MCAVPRDLRERDKNESPNLAPPLASGVLFLALGAACTRRRFTWSRWRWWQHGRASRKRWLARKWWCWWEQLRTYRRCRWSRWHPSDGRHARNRWLVLGSSVDGPSSIDGGATGSVDGSPDAQACGRGAPVNHRAMEGAPCPSDRAPGGGFRQGAYSTEVQVTRESVGRTQTAPPESTDGALSMATAT